MEISKVLKKSKDHNPNYLCRIVKISMLKQHKNADRLKIAIVCNEPVIVGTNVKVGNVFIFFPSGSKIDSFLLSNLNAYRNSEKNVDKNKKGFFEDNGRVKAIKLRGEYSNGYLVDINEFAKIYDLNPYELKNNIGLEFDIVNGRIIIEKYLTKKKQSKPNLTKKKAPKQSSIILDNTVTLHVDTKNLRMNMEQINPNDLISISYKIHGTSFHVSNTPVKKNLNIIQKFLKRIGFEINDKEYKIIYGSKRVIKNDTNKINSDFYDVDIYKEVSNLIEKKIPKNYQVYGEIFGYLPGTKSMIQKDYDYGCKEGIFDYIIYRVKKIDIYDNSIELSTPQIIEFCNTYGLNYMNLFYYGYAKDLYPHIPPHTPDWKERFLKELESDYTEKRCFLCRNNVVEEGIVLRKDNLFSFEAYKLKSYGFILKEQEDIDDNSFEN